MRSFFKMFFASCLGFVVGGAVLTLLSIWIISAIGKSASKSDKVKANSVLMLKLNQPLPESSANVPVSPFSFSMEGPGLGLQDFVTMMKNAQTDDKIKGVYMEIGDVAGGFASLSVVRRAIEDFKTSGKFVIAYSDNYSQRGYYMASVAEKVYINPYGGLSFNGFVGEVDFIKGLLDKLGVKAQIFYCGKFKAATEPLRRTDMSEENRAQIREYLGGMYSQFLQSISSSRKVDVAELQRIADGLLIRTAQDAVKYKLADGTRYKDQVLAELREKLGLEATDAIPSVSAEKYFKASGKKKDYSAKDKIAVIYAEGAIVDGEGEEGSIGGERYARMIRKIYQDKKVKAIVLRVNSPGGSALASEVILRELQVAQDKGLKVVVSMGDLAASGGYYISALANRIFAEPNTITGSIGVFGILPNVREFTEKKLGVTVDTVRTGKFAVMGNPYYELNEAESQIIQESVDTVYMRFKTRVAVGRKMGMEKVEEIAQGRVWLGNKAKDLGLVDELGDLNAAIAYTAKEAGLEKYRTVEYPEAEEPIQKLLKQFSGKDNVRFALEQELGEVYTTLRQARDMARLNGVQMRTLYEVKIK